MDANSYMVKYNYSSCKILWARVYAPLSYFFFNIVKFQIYMFVMEHLIMEDTVYLYNRNLNKVVHLHIMILKLASIICIEI